MLSNDSALTPVTFSVSNVIFTHKSLTFKLLKLCRNVPIFLTNLLWRKELFWQKMPAATVSRLRPSEMGGAWEELLKQIENCGI